MIGTSTIKELKESSARHNFVLKKQRLIFCLKFIRIKSVTLIISRFHFAKKVIFVEKVISNFYLSFQFPKQLYKQVLHKIFVLKIYMYCTLAFKKAIFKNTSK